jgi:nucleotide-binding universal stress UspA family protein
MFVDAGFRLGCFYEPPLPENGAAYLRYLGRLLNSPPRLLPRLPESGIMAASQSVDDADLDLLLYWEPERPFWRQWLGWTPAIRVVERSPASVLVVRQPRWPLRRILLILRADEKDEAAIQWLERLVGSVRVELFVLPIVPLLPTMHRLGSLGNLPLQAEVVLAPNTFSGAQLQRLAALCAAWDVEARLLLHDSEPQYRMEWAAHTSNCDLVLLSHVPHHWLSRRFLGDLIRPLLRHTDRPVLVAKNTSANDHHNNPEGTKKRR